MNNLLRHPTARWVNTILYVIVCHVGWFVCVIGAARDVPWIGAIFAIASLCYHLFIAPRPYQEIKLVLLTLVVAFVWETAMVRTDLLVYPNGMIFPDTAPYWIMALWLLLAIQFNVLYTWFKAHLLFAALAGAIAGPLAFRAGVAMGAARFPHPATAMVVLALGWGVIFPALLTAARRWNGMAISTVGKTPAKP